MQKGGETAQKWGKHYLQGHTRQSGRRNVKYALRCLPSLPFVPHVWRLGPLFAPFSCHVPFLGLLPHKGGGNMTPPALQGAAPLATPRPTACALASTPFPLSPRRDVMFPPLFCAHSPFLGIFCTFRCPGQAELHTRSLQRRRKGRGVREHRFNPPLPLHVPWESCFPRFYAVSPPFWSLLSATSKAKGPAPLLCTS